MERQGHLLSNSRTAPVGITLLHFDDRTDEFCARTFRAGLPAAGRTASSTFLCSWLYEWLAVSKASERLRNGADELDAPRAPSSQRGSGSTRVDWRSFAGAIQDPWANGGAGMQFYWRKKYREELTRNLRISWK
ncbi:MAG: hypothetical protein DMG42_32530 [Acidobacteria bacterium]|nr:MAG: hypothetical protein DMG42_32530 [Acidobacteriota bacterium]